jgi:hypothetical protein
MTLVKDLLHRLDLGNSVAEFDEALETYFVETESFRALVSGKVDVVAGDKGTGKTALYRVLQKRYASLGELSKIEVLTAFNPAGNPVFQKLTQVPPLTEGQYVTVWKSYFLSLAGNWLLGLYEGAETNGMRDLDVLLKKVGLRSADDSASTVFSKLFNTFARPFKPKAAEVGLSVSETGIPIITPKVEFEPSESGPVEPQETKIVPHEESLHLLNECLAESDLTLWVVLDRLDEAFQGYPNTERPALRALFRTYLDLLEFDRLRVKLFVRKDVFRKVVHGGFVNLTHVNARKLEIVWDEEDLLNLLCKRIRGCQPFAEPLGLNTKGDEETFNIVFPPQVDVGLRKPTSWAWMMSRIRDGNGIKPPRNLIDLATKAQQAQQRSEERTARVHATGVPLIEADAMRRALERLSAERVEDTLLAEAAELAPMIDKFRDGKAEHNLSSLAELLGVPETDVKSAIKPLVEMGFLEESGESYKVPMLYRDGLSITQGKAFDPGARDDERE